MRLSENGIRLSFCVGNISEAKQNGIFIYRKYEYSFDFIPPQNDEECAVLVDDVTISFVGIEHNATLKLATNVGGYNHYKGWIPKELQTPVYIEGNLLWVDENRDWGYIVRVQGSSEWPTYYDIETGWVCIGSESWDLNDSIVKFGKSYIAVINHEQHLIALWLQPEIIENEIQEEKLAQALNES